MSHFKFIGPLAACAALALTGFASLAEAEPRAPSPAPQTRIDFGAAPDEELLDGGPAPSFEPGPVRRATADVETADVEEDEGDGRYWFVRAARPQSIARHGSFTTVTFRARRAAPAEVTLVPPGASLVTEGSARLREAIVVGPQRIDVEAARLDARGYRPDGLDVIDLGGPKIIRVAPDFDARHD